jgi:hypothetical protein
MQLIQAAGMPGCLQTLAIAHKGLCCCWSGRCAQLCAVFYPLLGGVHSSQWTWAMTGAGLWHWCGSTKLLAHHAQLLNQYCGWVCQLLMTMATLACLSMSCTKSMAWHSPPHTHTLHPCCIQPSLHIDMPAIFAGAARLPIKHPCIHAMLCNTHAAAWGQCMDHYPCTCCLL